MAEATYYGTGRRKTSVARVRLVPGQGNIVINGRELKDYFDLKTLESVSYTHLHKRPENLRKNQFLLDKDKVGTVVLRHGTRDELFYPRGMQGSQKLFKCMQDLKIPAVKRKYWPLAADAEHIYWIGGMRGSRFGLPDEHTETFLLLTLRLSLIHI